MDSRKTTAGKFGEYDGYDRENDDARLVDQNFIENEGLSSKATNFGGKRGAESKDGKKLEDDVNEALYQEELQAIAIEEAQEATRRAIYSRQKMIREQQRVSGAMAKMKGGAGMARWGGISIAVMAWFWQMLAGAVSLIGLGGKGAVDHFLGETLVGKVLDKTIGYFVDFHNLIPFDMLGMAFWAIATMIGVCSFFGFLLFFFITGARPFHSTISHLIAAVVFACCILPVANLFPAVPVWVAYVNLTSTIGAFRGSGGRG